MAENTKKVLILKNGEKHDITGETSRYWLCRNTQFKKGNPAIKEIAVKAEKKEKPKEEEISKDNADKE